MKKKTGVIDVAQAADVSPATVDRVLNGRGGVSPDKERRVLEWARKLKLDRNLQRRPNRMIRVGVIMQRPSNPFYELLGQAFAKANQDYFDVNMLVSQHYFDIQALDDTVQLILRLGKQLDALIVVLQDHPHIISALREIARRIPVVTLASDLPHSGRMSYVGLDNRAAGRVAGDLMGRLVGPAGGGIIVVSGLQQFIGQGEREMGFRTVLAERHPQCQLLAVLETREQPEQAERLVSEVLSRRQNIAGIYNLSSGDQEIARSMKTFRQDKPLTFITHELTPERKKLLIDGVIDIVIDQNPTLEVATAMTLIASHFGRSDVMTINQTTPINIYTRENCW